MSFYSIHSLWHCSGLLVVRSCASDHKPWTLCAVAQHRSMVELVCVEFGCASLLAEVALASRLQSWTKMCRQVEDSMQYEGRYLVSDFFDGTLPAGIEAPGQELPVTPMVHPKLQELLLARSSGCGFCLTCIPALTSCTPALTSCTPSLTSCTKLWHEVNPLYQALVFGVSNFPATQRQVSHPFELLNLFNVIFVYKLTSDCLDMTSA